MFYSENSIKFYYKEIFFLALTAAAFLPTILWMWDRWFDENSYSSFLWRKGLVGIQFPLLFFGFHDSAAPDSSSLYLF